MPICPKCGTRISYLIYITDVHEKRELRLFSNNELNFSSPFSLSFDSFSKKYFECPKCEEVLFTKQENAVNFLKGEK